MGGGYEECRIVAEGRGEQVGLSAVGLGRKLASIFS